jgi:hypothetical protein
MGMLVGGVNQSCELYRCHPSRGRGSFWAVSSRQRPLFTDLAGKKQFFRLQGSLSAFVPVHATATLPMPDPWTSVDKAIV